MRGGHARRPPVPFWVVALALVVVLGVMVVSASARGDDAGTAGAVAVVTPSPDGNRVVASPSPSPSPSPAPPAPSREPIVIHGAGDVSLDPERKVRSLGREHLRHGRWIAPVPLEFKLYRFIEMAGSLAYLTNRRRRARALEVSKGAAP